MIISTTMKRLCLSLVVAAALSLGSASASDHTPPPVAPANTFAAFDVHKDEQVTIAAEPYETDDKQSIFRLNYVKTGFMPIRFVVTNDSDKPISLRDARIHFVTASGEKVQAAESEDVERRTTRVAGTGERMPIPSPIPIRRKPKTKMKEIEQDFSTFEYQSLVVEPHTTRAGFLFYDIDGLSNPLVGAKLLVRMVKDSTGKELFFFEIPFDKYLSARYKSKD